MSRTWVNVAAAEWSDCGGGRGNAGIRSSNLGKNMTKTPKPETESDLEREYHRNRSRKRRNSKQLNLPYGNLTMMNLKNSTPQIEPRAQRHWRRVGSAAAATPTTQNIQEIPDWAEMTRAQRKKWKKWGGGEGGKVPALTGVASPSRTPQPPNRNATANACAWRGGCVREQTSFLETGTSRAPPTRDREDRQVQTYYLPAPRPSSSALFQRACLAWD